MTSIAFGITLLSFGTIFSAINELKYIKYNEEIRDPFETVIEIKDIEAINTQNEGKLIYISGPIHVEEPLTEPDYGIIIPAVNLKKRVQMYQWIEELNDEVRNDELNNDQYIYYRDWRGKFIDSSNYSQKEGHQNPSFPFKSTVTSNEKVFIGVYMLCNYGKEQFTNYIPITSDERPVDQNIKMHSGLYYHTDDIWNLRVGDIRIQFSYAGHVGDYMSIVALQKGNEISTGDFFILEHGKTSLDEMIRKTHHSYVKEFLFYRFIGWILFYTSSLFFAKTIDKFRYKWSSFSKFLEMDGKLSINTSLATFTLVILISSLWCSYNKKYSIFLITIVSIPFILVEYLIKESNTYKQL